MQFLTRALLGISNNNLTPGALGQPIGMAEQFIAYPIGLSYALQLQWFTKRG